MLVLGTVIVDGHGDAVALDEFLHPRHDLGRGGDDHEGHAALFGILEVELDGVVRIFLDVDGPPSDDPETGLFDLSPRPRPLVL